MYVPHGYFVLLPPLLLLLPLAHLGPRPLASLVVLLRLDAQRLELLVQEEHVPEAGGERALPALQLPYAALLLLRI